MKKENRKIKKENSYCLPLESRLNQRYIIKKVLGEGGFGITYLGWDEVLEMPVAIKEYYPEGMVGRRPQGKEEHTLYIYEDGKRIVYEKGKEAFLKEARMLSQFFGLEGIVLVRDYFQENETAYIVMEYIEGTSVKEQVREKGAYSVEETLELMKPVLQALHTVHEKGLIHRDLSPDNIIVNSQGKLKLIDFGAARYASAQEQKTITLMYKRGFAAFEQYRVKGEQGAWTDVYGIAATMYFMMTGRIPEESADRVIRDELVLLSEMPEIRATSQISSAIEKAMAILPENRYSNVEKFYQELYGEPIPVANSVQKQQENVNVAPSEEESRESDTVFAEKQSLSEKKNSPETERAKHFFSTKTLGLELQRVMGNKGRADLRKHRKWIWIPAGVLVVVMLFVFWMSDGQKQTSEDSKKEKQTLSLQEKEKKSVSDSQRVSMPKLTGTTRKEAKQKLNKAGLSKIQWKYQYSNRVAKGKIIRQNISEGKEIDKVKKIVLVVSKGKKPLKVTSRPESSQKNTSTPSSGEGSNSSDSSSENSSNSGSQDDSRQNFVGSLDSVFE